MIPRGHIINSAIYAGLYFDSIFSGFTSADATDRANQVINDELSKQQSYANTGMAILNEGINANSTNTANTVLAQGKQNALDQYQKAESTPITTGGNTYKAENAFSNKASTKSYQTRTNEAKAENQSYNNLANQETISALNTKNYLGTNEAESKSSASSLSARISQAEDSANNTWLAEMGQVSTDLTDNGIYKSAASSGASDYSSGSGIYKDTSGSTPISSSGID